MPSLSAPLPTLCSVLGRGWRKKQKSRPFLLEPLSRGDVCALSCSISRAAYISHPPRVRYGPLSGELQPLVACHGQVGTKRRRGDPPYP